MHGHRLAYLDSAATSLKPRVVIDAVTRVFVEQAGSPHRGVHALAEAAAIACDEVRAEIADWLGAAAAEIVFTSGTTASINLVASSWGRRFVEAGDAVIVSELEHHSNLVPWQELCADRGAELRVIPVDDRGRMQLDQVRWDGAKLVAVAHVSNVAGTIAPIEQIVERAHAAGAIVVVDGAQAVAHLPVDVRRLGCDAYAFSGHKMYGPPGIGVLWARAELLARMPPWQTGGGMVASVDIHAARYRDPPHRFEAGTSNISGIVGLGAALAYLRALDVTDEPRLHGKLVAALRESGARILGEPEMAVVAFEVPRVHAHDVATIVDGEGVAIRSGHHCAEPLHRRFGMAASCRASIGCYTGDDDIDQLVRAIASVREMFP